MRLYTYIHVWGHGLQKLSYPKFISNLYSNCCLIHIKIVKKKLVIFAWMIFYERGYEIIEKSCTIQRQRTLKMYSDSKKNLIKYSISNKNRNLTVCFREQILFIYFITLIYVSFCFYFFFYSLQHMWNINSRGIDSVACDTNIYLNVKLIKT